MKKFKKGSKRFFALGLAILMMVVVFAVSVSATGGETTTTSSASWISDAIATVTEAITGFAEAGSSAVVTVFNNVFTDGNGGISNFALYSLFFLGFSLIAGLIGSVIKKVG